MLRTAMTAGLVLALWAPAALAQDTVFTGSAHDFRAVPVVTGLVNPWGMAFLPGGDLLVTERPGRLRVVRNGRLVASPVAGVPAVVARGQGGLLDVALHPDFSRNRLVYLTYSKPMGDSGLATTAVARGRLEGDTLRDVADIFVALTRGAPGHFGSRMAFDGAGHLFVTVGERMVPPRGELEKHPAQDLSNHHGKVIRLYDDGRVPEDNPFVGREGARPEIWSYGHRNMQGLAFDPRTGDLWETEHAPQGGDEVNRIRKGLNYGWPVIGFGVNYGTGLAIHGGTRREGMEQPLHVWVPSIGPSGLMLYTGDRFPGWKGSLFAGGLAGERLERLTITGQRVELAEELYRHQGRIRDVRQGPDGFVYLAIDSDKGAPTAIVRLEPVKRK